ncbi:MAG: redoxin domain-containing protein [Chloroflexi bacterium]|nr:redoxin domain-containing protein [Chloroflexota bacterium]
MRQQQGDFDAKDVEVLVVSFDPPRRIRGYCRRLRLPFRCLSDEPREAYRAFGLSRASWLRTLTPKALAPYVRLYLRRGGPRPMYGGQDLRQMGGDFVVSPDGRLAFAYASHDPADRPSVDDLLAAIG